MPTRPLDSVLANHVPAGTLRDAVDNAIHAAAGVHEVRDTATRVPVFVHSAMTPLGLYAHEQGGRPIAIFVNDRAADPGLTFLHEVGHYMDQHAIDLPGYASVSQELSDWREAALKSQGVADLIEAWVSPPTPSDPARVADVEAAVRALVEYLLGWRELFARSYCQFVTLRSDDNALQEELEKSLEPDYREQWDEADFDPIATALDDVFGQLGWL